MKRETDDEFLQRMERTITPSLIQMNDSRCGIARMDCPLPAPFENIRAFFLRLKNSIQNIGLLKFEG